ncbi:MAG: hypothetical protein Q8N23_16165 [Archangium sp.]|nr:hypothetical protein [Archangium sp.]MDP3154212.1 hypothetical protein [Archangium sp.]MDP3575900.1 hypothetical protein [Archangium sp.]
MYRIRTANSTYELEVQGEAATQSRRCAVLTCVEPKARAGAAFEDSMPLIGGAPLYDSSPLEWIGRTLSVGTARTSEIQAVDFVATTSGPRRTTTNHTTVGPPPREEPQRQWAPFPLGQIEMVEAAASVLKAVCHQHHLPSAIQHDAHLVKRLKLALAECGLMLEAMERRGS